jgi:hypothetical protein
LHNEAGDDGDGQWLLHFRALADGERQGKQRQDSGDGGHGNGTQVVGACEDQRFALILRGREFLLLGKVKDGNFGHDADDHRHPHHRGDIQLYVGEQQSNEYCR